MRGREHAGPQEARKEPQGRERAREDMREEARAGSGRGVVRLLAAAVAVMALLGLALRPAPQWEFAFVSPPPAGEADPPFFRTVLDLRAPGRTMHSPSILRAAQPRLIWFEGSREAARDVRIMAAELGGDGSGPVRVAPLLAAGQIGGAMRPRQAVLVLGNTLQADPDDSDRLLATVLSVGGWAAASVAEVRLREGTVASARKLALSPFLNRSYLVRNRVLRLADGDIAVPAYFEMGNAFGVLVRLDRQGRVRASSRIGSGKVAIQPAVVVTGPETAVALMRPFDGTRQLYRAETRDGGRSWSRPAPLAGVPNPDAPVAALRLDDGRILMAFNDDPRRASDLTLAVSDDGGRSWKRIARLEESGREAPAVYRYPDLARLDDGSFLLAYSTFAKGGIRAHRFNMAWILEQERKQGDSRSRAER